MSQGAKGAKYPEALAAAKALGEKVDRLRSTVEKGNRRQREAALAEIEEDPELAEMADEAGASDDEEDVPRLEDITESEEIDMV